MEKDNLWEKVRVRFAPSPTGPLHIGGARSALFNYLLARRYGGTFIVRIEDTDLERSDAAAEESILSSLRWLGIDWDEGIGVGGPYGPYRQMERLHTYQPFVEQLLKNDLAYPCYCTEEELEAERQELLARGEMPYYSGRCAHLSSRERMAKEREGRRPAIRFRVPPGREVVIDDLVRGRVTFETGSIGDFIIMKSDGIPVYNFACVIDDALMEITHVVRGEEHLSNTPRQALLYDALGLPRPYFAHISLILGQDRTKMSKRHGATSVIAYQEAGFLPEALINYLALLGWSPPGEEEILSLKEITAVFSLERVARNPAVFDMDKLRWINGCYIRQSSLDYLAHQAIPFLYNAGLIAEPWTRHTYAWVRLLVEATRDRLESLQDIVKEARVFMGDRVLPEDEEAKAALKEEHVPRLLEAFMEKLSSLPGIDVAGARALIKELGKTTGVSGRRLFMPLRVALTGRTHGVELYYVIPLLGVRRCKERVQAALAG